MLTRGGGRGGGGGGGGKRLLDKTSIYDRSQERRIYRQLLLFNFKGFLLHLLLCLVLLSSCLLSSALPSGASSDVGVYASFAARSCSTRGCSSVGLHATEMLKKAT